MADGELMPIYTWRDAQAAGLTRAQRRDDGVRVLRGAYVSRALPLGLIATCRAAASVLPAAAVFSHGTAAALLGAPIAHRDLLQVTVPVGTARPRHQQLRAAVRDLPAVDVVDQHGLRVTGGARTWLDLAAELPSGELLAVGDSLVRAGHLVPDALTHALANSIGARGIVHARRVAPLLSPAARSRPESLIRWYLIDSPLPDPEVAVPIVDRSGRVRVHADLGYARWKVAIEYEGRQHAERDQFRRDVDRYSLCAADGWLVIRFADVHLGRRYDVVDRVGRALLSRGARW